MGDSEKTNRRRTTRREEDRALLCAQRELEAARRISEVLFESPDSEAVIERALVTAVEVVDAEGGSILIADSSTSELVFRHSIGVKPVPVGTTIPWDKGIAGHVFKTGRPVIIDDVTQDKHHFKGIDEQQHFLTHDMITAPLRRWNGETIGVIEVLNKRGGRFDRNDMQLLLIVSAIAASAIERARLNEEAKLAEMSRLYSQIGHDVKNLLTPVVLGSGLLDELLQAVFSHLPEAKQQELERRYDRGRKMIASFSISSSRIQQLLKEVSDCIIGISTSPRFVSCNLEKIVGEVFEAVGTPAQQAGVALVRRGLEDLPQIKADENRLFNAFYNLVNNAIGAMPAGGAITISGEQDVAGGGVRLSVADTGSGMPAEVAAGLFTGMARSRKRLGSGLGVRIVKDVIDAHGGRIEVRSQVGVGTTFELFLPLAPPGA